MDIQNWLVSVGLGGIAALIWWGFNHIISEQHNALKTAVEAQKILNQEIHSLALSVARICGNVEKAVQWQGLHDALDEERHELNADEHKRLMDLVEKLRA